MNSTEPQNETKVSEERVREELMHCPLCEATPRIDAKVSGTAIWYDINCTPGCGLHLEGQHVYAGALNAEETARAKAVTAWNRRAALDTRAMPEAEALNGGVSGEEWLRNTAMNVMLATEVEEAERILASALSASPPPAEPAAPLPQSVVTEENRQRAIDAIFMGTKAEYPEAIALVDMVLAALQPKDASNG